MTNKIVTLLRPKPWYGLILLLIIGLALFLRIYPRLDDVFRVGWVRFAEVDPWYHIRLLENLLQHFPQRINFDPYTFFPYGQTVYFAPFFDLMLGFIVWAVGIGSPSLHTMETVAAYFPAILGALTVIPVFLIGKELFNKKVGLISAALLAILPGNFLARSLLGVTDHHVAETLFSTISVLFFIMAIKSAIKAEVNFTNLHVRDWSRIKKPLIYALSCGFFLGIYIITWVGGLLFVFIFFVYLIIQYVLDYWKGKSTDYLGIIGIPLFFLALIILIPFLGQGGLRPMHLVSLAFGAVALIALSGLSWLMEHKGIKRGYYLLSLAGTILLAVVIVYAVSPSLFFSMVSRFGIFFPQGGSMTITEVQPLFFGFKLSSLTHSLVWGFFTTGLFIVPISFILIGYTTKKNANDEKIVFLIWSLLILAATLGQNRFSYYFAVNVALFGGYFCWRIAGWVSKVLALLGYVEKRPESTIYTVKKKKGKASKAKQTGFTAKYLKVQNVSLALAIIIGFFLVFYPNISPAIAVARVDTGPDEDWHDSLLWVKENTPDPFQDPDFYNEMYQPPPPPSDPLSYPKYPFPKSAYGVMSAWDYGHWITRIAHRIPNSNPIQFGARNSALFFTAQDESSANKLLDKLGSRYIIIDRDMATDMFFNSAAWVGESATRYGETYYQRNESGKLESLNVYYPEYYQSMSSRLYNFGGQAVVPKDSTWVIKYEDRIDSRGTIYKEITSSKLFPTYEEAVAFSRATPKSRVVGTDPFSSPVPLERLNDYQMIHGSSTTVIQKNDTKTSLVEVFEYKP